MKNNSIYNQNGFSIIQVLVASTVASFIGLGISSQVINQSQNISYQEDRFSHQNFGKELRALLGDQDSCQNTINNLVVPAAPNAATNLTEIRDSADQVVYNTTNRNTFEGLRIRSIQLKNQDISGALTQGRALVEIQVERARAPAGLDNQVMRTIVLEKQVTIDGSRRVTSCLDDNFSGDFPCLTAYRAINYTTHTIPSDAKFMTFTIPSRTERYDRNNPPGTSNDDRTDPDWTTRTIGGVNITVLVGKTKLNNGTVIRAGGRITTSGSSAFYNGISMFTRPSGTRYGSESVAGGINQLPICDPDNLVASDRFIYSK